MKKIISVFLCILTVTSAITLSPLTANAKYRTYKYKNFEYDFAVNTDGKAYDDKINILNYYGEEKELVLPAELKGKKVVRVSVENNNYVESITVSEGIEEITSFFGCSNLNQIKLCSTIKRFEDWAIRNTAYYNNKDNWDGHVLYVDNYIAQIEQRDSQGNLINDLGELNIREGTKKLLYFSFDEHKTGFSKISIPASLTSLPLEWFSDYNRQLCEINVSKSNKKYASKDGILYNKNMTKLLCYPQAKSGYSYRIPESVTTINPHAFEYNNTLKELRITKNVNRIPKTAFNVCLALKAFKVSSKNSRYSSKGGILFNKNKTTLIHFPSKHKKVKYKIPASVNKIYNNAFRFSKIKSVTISKSVKRVCSGAFFGCFNLKKIRIPKTVKRIEAYAFGYGYKYYEESEFNDSDFYIQNLTFIVYKGSAAYKYYRKYAVDKDNKDACFWKVKYIK